MKVQKMKKLIALLLALLMVFSMVACGAKEEAPAAKEEETKTDAPKEEAKEEAADPVTIRIAFPEEPETLDTLLNTVDNATAMGQQMFECLYVYDDNNVIHPMLAESDSISEDGLTVTINLRQGVLFHNGKEMTSEDVKTCLDRWIEFGNKGSLIRDYIESVDAVDTYTVQLNFKSVYAPWKDLLAYYCGCCYIVPSEIAEAAGAEALTEEQYIGTGPYKFVEHQSGYVYIMEKFEDYTSRTDAPNGDAGAREALADYLHFYVVKDVNTRTSGLKAGDYDYAYTLSGDMYENLASTDGIEAVTTAPLGAFLYMNKKSGILSTNYELCKALEMAIDRYEVMLTALGSEDLFSTTSNFYPKGNVYNPDGTESSGYNVADPVKAAEYAAAAGYNGEPITFLIFSHLQTHIDICTVIVEQLREAGFNIDAQYLERATLMEVRKDPESWDLFFTHVGISPLPILFDVINPDYAGWWTTDERNELVAKFIATVDDAERVEVWAELQDLIWTQYPVINVSHYSNFDAYSSDLTGIPETISRYTHFWGVTKN